MTNLVQPSATSLKRDEFNTFFSQYQAVRTEAAARKLQSFQDRFISFKTAYQRVKEKALTETKATAPSFNIFHILGLSHYEVRTHSAFLAHLLNPNATHGQQHLFLETFLAICQQTHPHFPQPSAPAATGRWQISTELHTAYGNLDIVLRSPDLGYLCVIENKIYAGEQEEQLQRYASWMATQEDDYTEQALIYLTPWGNSSTTDGGNNYYRLSYRQHINQWLANASPNIAASSVQGVVSQYNDLIRKL